MLQAHDRILTAPFRGAPHTVADIKRGAFESQSAAHYEVRLAAEEAVQHLQSKDFLSEILAVYHWVHSHTRYANDPRTVELVKAPWVVVREIMAGKIPSIDCDEFAALIVAMCMQLGRETRVVTVAYRNAFFRGERQYQHVFAEVKEPRTGIWIVCDPVAAEDTAGMLRRVVYAKIWPIA